MTKKTKLLTAISLILMFITFIATTDNSLYTICEHISDRLNYSVRYLFPIVGVVLYSVTLAVSIYTSYRVRKELGLSDKDTILLSPRTIPQYDTYEEAKSNCNILCIQCGEHCCPMVRKK